MATNPTYEFSAEEDAVFLALATSAARVGVAGYGLGGALLLAGLLGLVRPTYLTPQAAPVVAAAGLLAGAPALLAGHRLREASRRLRAVAETSGDDVAHLMAAIERLAHAFTAVVAMLTVDALVLAAVVVVALPPGSSP